MTMWFETTHSHHHRRRIYTEGRRCCLGIQFTRCAIQSLFCTMQDDLKNPPNCVSPPYFDTIVLDPTSDCPVLCHLDLLEFASSGPYASSLQLECAVQLLQVFPSIGVTNTAKARWRCDAQNLAMSNENNVEAWKIMQYTSTKPMIEIVFTRRRPVDVLSHNRKTLYSLLAIERTNM